MVRLIPGDSNRAGDPSPVMSCAARGLPCLLSYPWSGGLLLHLFTLTKHPERCLAVYFLLHFPSDQLQLTVPRFRKARYPMASGLSSTQSVT